MKKIILLILISLFGLSCNNSGVGTTDDDITELPEVRFNNVNYSQTDIEQRVPDWALFNKFNDAYRGKYSDDLKTALVDYIINRAKEFGFDEDECMECIWNTEQLGKEVIALPYLAERARYESVDAWIFEFTWGHDVSLGHFRCFVIDASSHETLLYITCR